MTTGSPDAGCHLETGLAMTVIIPTFNSGKYLDIALESLLAQTRRPDEVLVVDAGSRDNTAALVEGFSKRLPLRFISAPKTVAGVARNIGIDIARGEIISFLDSDDIYLSNRLELAERVFCEDPLLDAVHGFNVQWSSGEDRLFFGYDYQRELDEYVEIFEHSLINLSALSVRRSFLLQYGVRFPAGARARYGEDWDFCAKLVAKNAKLQFVQEPVSVVTVRADSHTQPHLQWKMKLCALLTLQDTAGPVLSRRHSKAVQDRVRRAIDLSRLKLIVTLLLSGRPYLARLASGGFSSLVMTAMAPILVLFSRYCPKIAHPLFSRLGMRYASSRHKTFMSDTLQDESALQYLRKKLMPK